MSSLFESPVFSIALTLGVYQLATRAYARWRHAFLNSVLLSIAALILFLLATGIEYETYFAGGRIISFFLGPAVVALAVPLYERLGDVRRNVRAIAAAILAGGATGVLSAAGIAALLGASRAVVLSLAPKSATTPIAMGIAEELGGIPALTAAIVIATGVLGAVIGPWFLRLAGVRSRLAFGLALGAAAHGIGTARAAEEGTLEEAMSGLALCLNGIATAVLAPLLLHAFDPLIAAS
ncbi:MAG: LrgB family protein [Planctomycetes bacterium]|nr:LrgB family protein [Planctomycetota bacterium]